MRPFRRLVCMIFAHRPRLMPYGSVPQAEPNGHLWACCERCGLVFDLTDYMEPLFPGYRKRLQQIESQTAAAIQYIEDKARK